MLIGHVLRAVASNDVAGRYTDAGSDGVAMRTYRHFLKATFNTEWTEVTKEEWIKAERRAGFRPKLWSGHPEYINTYATGGFSDGSIRGTYTTDGEPPKYA